MITLSTITISALIPLLVAVIVALVVIYCIGLFISDGRILTVIRLIVGLIVLIYALRLLGIAI